MKKISIVTYVRMLLKTIMNNNTVIFRSIVAAVITIVFSLLLNACKKESLAGVSVNTSESADAIATVPYVSCGMKINVFTPNEYSANKYAFSYTINGQQTMFSILPGGQLSFTSYDKFTFEYAGYMENNSKVKSWRIRRTDGKYLTAGVQYPGEGLEYKDKLTGAAAVQQTFLFASLGNGQYKLVLPKLPICNLAAIWDDIDTGYNISNYDYNDPHLASGRDTKIFMSIVPLVNH